jgi:hypothetical protein
MTLPNEAGRGAPSLIQLLTDPENQPHQYVDDPEGLRAALRSQQAAGVEERTPYEQFVSGNHSIAIFKDGKMLAADADVYASPAPAVPQGMKLVPVEIDREKHRAVLDAWNSCMANADTLESTWPKLVKAISASPREGGK